MYNSQGQPNGQCKIVINCGGINSMSGLGGMRGLN